ncbi:MAG: phosphoribosylanthranilate isomerase [Sedimentisphaerales bacterium]|jgi:phosphoribosylanthranilate isomerase|nr:phosphoribosylanthranilate isomerase [Sedimentisphaerales bacterium]
MLIVKVKICGITNYKDAVAAVDMGADLLGFNFYRKSPRYIEPQKCVEIIRKLPAFVNTVGVFVNEAIERIFEIKNLCQLDWVQLHGDESPEFCRGFLSDNVLTMKAIRVKDEKDIAKAEDFFTDAILLDAFDPAKYGGTGISFDWNILGHMNKRVFLAGGVNPGNAVQAVELGVYGIDVCSGIEQRPGKKDHKKMKKLFDNIHHLRA